MGLLTEEEKQILISGKHGWEIYASNGWVSCERPGWSHFSSYRAKPAPVVKSVWVNVYPEPQGSGTEGVYLSLPHNSFEKAHYCADENRISIARFDLIDGVLSVELEPLENNNG
jgi:hypothetical protein